MAEEHPTTHKKESDEHHVKPVHHSLGKELHDTKSKGVGKISGVHYVLFGLIAVVLLFNIIQSGSMSGVIEEAVEKAKEAATPALVELVVLTNEGCEDCFSVEGVVSSVKDAHTNITSEETLAFDSEEGKKLIEQYGITRIPSAIVTGDIEKAGIRNFEEQEDVLVFTQVLPPYTDASSGKVHGLVDVTLLTTPSCEQCIDLAVSVTELKTQVTIATEKSVAYSSPQGKDLIAKYAITQVPTLILSSELEPYTDISSNWEGVGSVEKDGSYVMRNIAPPYVDPSSGKTMGLVHMIMVKDDSCTECYDVEIHKQIMGRFGLIFSGEETVDISSAQGQDLKAKYSITEVPMVILSKETEAYDPLVSVWNQVGDVADDGSYIFRNNVVLGETYKDLVTGKVVVPEPQEAS